jgi:hypothetical protein
MVNGWMRWDDLMMGTGRINVHTRIQNEKRWGGKKHPFFGEGDQKLNGQHRAFYDSVVVYKHSTICTRIVREFCTEDRDNAPHYRYYAARAHHVYTPVILFTRFPN